MKPQIRTNADKVGVEVFVRMPDVDGYPRTFLTEDINAAASNADTLDGSFLTLNDYIMIGKLGTPGCEIIQVTSVTSGVQINFTGTTTFAHSQGEPVTYIPFNKVRIEESTDNGSSYSSISAANVTVKVNNPEHYYNRTSGSGSYYYRARFENTTTGLFSAYSDAVAGSGYEDNTVYAVKRRAVEACGMKMQDLYDPDGKVTDAYLNESLTEVRRKVHKAPGQKGRWEFRQEFEYNLGPAVAGTNRIALPTDMEDRNTMKNLLSVRIGGHRAALNPVSKRRWNELQQGIAHTTLAVAISDTAAPTITLTDSGDFEEGGSIKIATSGTEDSIDYTANNETTNVLSGVTNISITHAISTDVWQGTGLNSLPQFYTVFDGYLYFEVPIGTDYHGENIFIDYYRRETEVDSDADELDEPDYGMYVPYLKWKIRQKRDEGVSEDKDRDYTEYSNALMTMLSSEVSDQELQIIPQVPNSAEYVE